MGGRGARAAARFGGYLVVQYAPALLLLAVLIGFWEAWVQVRDTPDYILPPPSAIWSAYFEINDTLWPHVRTTTTEALAGLALAIVVGVVLAVLIASTPVLRRAIYPILVLSQTIPIIALAPLLIIWFGYGIEPKIYVVTLVGFFPIVVSTVDGLLNGADEEMVGLVRSMGGSKLQVLRVVRFPAALPSFFAGLKIAAAYSVSGAVFAESISAQSGLWVVIARSSASFTIDRVFVAIVLISVLSILLFGAVQLVARIATPWLYASREDSQ